MFVGPQGLEPWMTAPKTVVLPLHHGPIGLIFNKLFVGPQGLEPWTTAPKTVVLPLHHGPVLAYFV